MIYLLSKEQVKESWDFIYEEGIFPSLPPVMTNMFGIRENIYKSIMNDVLHVWVYKRPNEDILCVVTTIVQIDFCSGLKNLLIYTIKSFNEISKKDYEVGFTHLRAFAKKLGCIGITGYTTIDHVKNLVKGLGGNFEYYVYLEV
jgi:hypothetical protein